MLRFQQILWGTVLAIHSSVWSGYAAGDDPPAAAPPNEECWSGTLSVAGMNLVVQLRVFERDHETVAELDSVTQKAFGIPAMLGKEPGMLSFEIPIISAKFRGKLSESGNSAVGEWTQAGRSFPLTMTRKSGPPSKAEAPKRPQTPQAPFPYEERVVEVPHAEAGVTLAGTLLVPAGAGPFPAVVLVTGSGPQDRDESLMDHKPFWVLADHLARHEIAVLRYDDRGVGQSTGDFSASTTQDFAGDARAVVEFLRTCDHVDPSRVGIIGHSEGGLIATMLAASDLPLAQVVLLAGPGVPGDVIIESQITAMLRTAKLERDDFDEQLSDAKRVMAGVKGGTSAADLKQLIESLVSRHMFDDLESEAAREAAQKAYAERLRQLTTTWFAFFVNYDPRPDLKKVRCPVLALVGEKDMQVLPDVNVPELTAALKASGRDDCRCEQLSGLNHLFQSASTGSPMEYRLLEETMAPAVLQLVTEWIREH